MQQKPGIFPFKNPALGEGMWYFSGVYTGSSTQDSIQAAKALGDTAQTPRLPLPQPPVAQFSFILHSVPTTTL